MSLPSPELRALLDADRTISAPRPADRERNRRALARRLGVATALGAGAAKGSVLGWLSATSGAKFLATVTLVAASSGSAAWLVSSQPSADTRAAPRHRVEPTMPHVSLPPAQEQPATLPAPSVEAAAAPSAFVRQAAPSSVISSPAVAAPGTSARAFPGDGDDALAAETKLVGQAQVALRAGQTARALELLDHVARQFPSGALQEEAGAARVFALCQLGQSAQAREAAARFLHRFPSSPLAGRVRTSCAASQFPE